jgi:hypothetical protein
VSGLGVVERAAPPPPVPTQRRTTYGPDGWVCSCGRVCATVSALASHRQAAHGIPRGTTYRALGCAG